MELIKSDSLKEISIALSNFQAHQQPIKPNSTNPFLKNRYADLTALIESTKENLNANGLSVTQLLTNNGLTTILLHNSGEYIGSTFKIEPTEGKGTNAAQEMGIAITYSRRYAYGAILGLVTDEDTDGSGKKKPIETKYEYTPPKSPAPAKTEPKKGTLETFLDEPNKEQPEPAKKITQAQLKRLFAIVNENGYSTEQAKEIIKCWGYESSKDILQSDYDAIVSEFKSQGIQEPPEVVEGEIVVDGV